jgi:F-type H+-transporting ATPase subunit b
VTGGARRRPWRAAWTAAVLATLSSPLFAVVEGEHGEGGHEADTWLGIPRWIILGLNLVVFIGILVYFAGPAVAAFLGEKKNEVAKALAEAERQRAEAEQMAERLEAQVTALRAEVEELRQRAEQEGEREREEILRQAARERERIRQQTEDEIEHRLELARQELTRHAVALASRLAEKTLETEITTDDRRRLFDANLDRLESS